MRPNEPPGRGSSSPTWPGRRRCHQQELEVQLLEFGFEGGRVTASGIVPFESTASAGLVASWTGIDASGLARALAPASTLIPAGALSGQLGAQGPLSDPGGWSADARATVEPRPNARGRMSVGGNARLQLSEGSWRLDGKQVRGGVAPVTLALRGRVENSTVAGTVRLNETDLPKLLEALRIMNLATVPADTVTAGRSMPTSSWPARSPIPVMQAPGHMRGLAGAQIEAEEVDAEATGSRWSLGSITRSPRSASSSPGRR